MANSHDKRGECMPDIKYNEKNTRQLIGQQNGVDYWPQIGDIYTNNSVQWRIIEISIGAEVKCTVEKIQGA